ncbi:hypothetical protein [Loktanella sp. R86503]|uniref:hypothetical protein n=1 Tax=Loktanella sp. R86503 TaxID=3093847 RepID=UPI0036D8A78B
MDIYKLKLSQKEAALAASVTSRSVQNWAERGYIVPQSDKIVSHVGGGTKGANRTFTFYGVMHLAMTQALINAGLSEVKRAAAEAGLFAYGGGGGDIYDLPDREPGFPFHPNCGATVFAVGPYGSHDELWTPGKARDTYGNLRHRVGAGMVMVEPLDLFRDVVGRLGFNPGELLDTAYPDAATA